MEKSAQRLVRTAKSAIKTGREGNRSHSMTSDKRERMLSLCALIAKEHDPHKFSELLQELNDLLLEENNFEAGRSKEDDLIRVFFPKKSSSRQNGV